MHKEPKISELASKQGSDFPDGSPHQWVQVDIAGNGDLTRDKSQVSKSLPRKDVSRKRQGCCDEKVPAGANTEQS